jgi:Tol biopolymer transport system component
MAAGSGDSGSLAFNLDLSRLPLIAVRTSNADEVAPAADADHLAWSQSTRQSLRSALYLQSPGQPRAKVNGSGTNGFSGGFDGDTFVYQQVRRQQSNLYVHDLAGGGSPALPAGVNTPQWEWHPTISGDWLLFGRQVRSGRVDLVLLRNLVTGETRELRRLRWGRRTLAAPGQVNGNYAVWFRCTPACDVFLHDIAAETTTRVPNPSRNQQYSPSVTSDGTVYFAQSGRGCGASVRLVRQPLTGSSKVLASLGSGRDSFQTYALENGDGTTSVFFDRMRCSNNTWDVLKLVDP